MLQGQEGNEDNTTSDKMMGAEMLLKCLDFRLIEMFLGHVKV